MQKIVFWEKCDKVIIYIICVKYAEVVKLADTPALGAGALKSVRVQIPPSAHLALLSASNKKHEFIKIRVFFKPTSY